MPQIEDRYIVIKLTDFSAVASPDDIAMLAELCTRVGAHRMQRGAGHLESIVIEKDWPEYLPTERMLLDRVKGEEDEEGYAERMQPALASIAAMGCANPAPTHPLPRECADWTACRHPRCAC